MAFNLVILDSITLLLIFWYFQVTVLPPAVVQRCRVIFSYVSNIAIARLLIDFSKSLINFLYRISSIILSFICDALSFLYYICARFIQTVQSGLHRFNTWIQTHFDYSYPQPPQHQNKSTQTPDCPSCTSLRDRITSLLSTASTKADIAAHSRTIISEQSSELDSLHRQVSRSAHFLRRAEGQTTTQRREISSLREEVEMLRRDKDSTAAAAIEKHAQDLARLQWQNKRLATSSVQHMFHSLQQKQRALRAERDADVLADRVRRSTHERQELDRALAKMREENVRLERKASGEREGRIRAEVEREEKMKENQRQSERQRRTVTKGMFT
ncbi:hypothetical protein F4808DRAFT_424774 [Astrocystis sublimbata]|nr:hypothetical protein F4808DRAFT_424773 [Astrocystis sublimbata]KAI0201691.1 hypothetical protein F4808DRAFT_424774 [Astrocystis sublimbata]